MGSNIDPIDFPSVFPADGLTPMICYIFGGIHIHQSPAIKET